MALGANDGQSAGSLGIRCQLNVSTSSGHVGRNSHRTWLPSFGHYFGLALVLLGVQYLVANLAHGQHTAHNLRIFHGGSTYQYRTAIINQIDDFVRYGIVLLTYGAIHLIFFVFSYNRDISRNRHDVQLVDFPEFTRFGFSRTCHTRQLVVHTEVVLQGDSSVGLRRVLHFHILLRFNRLV